MSFKQCSILLEIDRTIQPPRPLTGMVPALFEALSDVLLPMEISYRVEGGKMQSVRPRMSGEEGDGILTRFAPEAGKQLLREFQEQLVGKTASQLWASAECAVFHQAKDDKPAWYGRWRMADHQYRELCTVRFYWDDSDLREVELVFPLSGYPLSSTALSDAGKIEDGDASTAAANRSRLLPVFGRIRSALGIDASCVDWSNQGDYGVHYPDDEADIEERWLPKLRSS